MNRFSVLADTQGNDDEEEELGKTSFQNLLDNKKQGEKEVPQSVFPYHKDLLFGTVHNDKDPFDHKDNSIEFIYYNLNHHGFGFLLHEDLEEIELDLLVIASWSNLWSLHGKADQFANKDTIEVLSIHHDTQAMFASVLPSEDGGEIPKPTFLEATCKGQLHYTSPHQQIDLSEREDEGTIEYQYSLSIPGCVLKHCKKHPLINGTGYSGAILSDTPTFLTCQVYVGLPCMVS